ncbi:hypothetical protein [Streptomyces sp. NPDC101150]
MSQWLGQPSIKVTVDQHGRERCRKVVATTFQGSLPEELAAGLAA